MENNILIILIDVVIVAVLAYLGAKYLAKRMEAEQS
jgi:hypothetical protein